MAESLNVITLISGGKDSFYSLFHCLQNGHKVVALGNLHPGQSNHETTDDGEEEEHDLNSFMYQTVGHTVIPLYEQALGIPLYRQEIVGTAVQTGTSYGHVLKGSEHGSSGEAAGVDQEADETESLLPLLKRIIAAHPEANALSTGAILSTYQRTRIESVALRLGLTPLSYLWQYPILPPGTQSSLLADMTAVGLDARIVKVASGGLDEGFLWENVADPAAVRRIERAMGRFGVVGDGAVLGEGGEFETLVVDGLAGVFKGRIVVKEADRRVVREGGGAAWLRILDASVEMKEESGITGETCRIPDLLETRFKKMMEVLDTDQTSGSLPQLEDLKLDSTNAVCLFTNPPHQEAYNETLHWTVQEETNTDDTISQQASRLVTRIRQWLDRASLEPSSIISTVIILRSMSDFASVNKEYGALFTEPNPPSRVTISCGSTLPPKTNIIIHLAVQATSTPKPERKALHVQSRSYWAPANIGPYSQAISTSLLLPAENSDRAWVVAIAGQIPLIPHTMVLPTPSNGQDQNGASKDFKLQAVLSLQHLVRIGTQMNVQWFTHTVAYLPSSSPPANPTTTTTTPTNPTTSQKSILTAKAWSHLHTPPPSDDDTTNTSDDDDDGEAISTNLWQQKYSAGMQTHSTIETEKPLPDFEILNGEKRTECLVPPFWAAEVEELPRGAGVEWAAGLGFVGARGSVKIYTHTVPSRCSIHQHVFGNMVHSIIIIPYTTPASDVQERLTEARKLLSYADTIESTTSWIDTSIPGIVKSNSFNGAIPCKSLWNGEGERLAAVFVFEVSLRERVGEKQ